MNALTPPLAVVAARLAPADESPDIVDPVDGDGDADADGNGTDWRTVAVPAHLLVRFERSSAAGPLAARPIGAGQIHLLAALPGFGAVLLDRWDAPRQRWRGWLVTPDASYAGPAGLVVEQRDAPVDPRAALVLCDLAIDVAVGQLGQCIGIFSAQRLEAVRWLQQHGAASGAVAQPGVVARCAVLDDATDYALTGTPLLPGIGIDPRQQYRAILLRGLAQLRIGVAPTTPVAAPLPSPLPLAIERVQPANSPRWLKTVAAVAAGIAVLQAGWILSPPLHEAPTEWRGGSGIEAGVRVRVLFRADVTEAELRTWLQQQKLEIVSGPDTMGAFTLLIKDKQQVLPKPGPDNPLASVNP